jgi:hypothetical protein
MGCYCSFVRGHDRIEIRRVFTETGVLLLVTEDGSTQTTFFREVYRALAQQGDLEAQLLQNAWSLAAFGSDRARFLVGQIPHAHNDRPAHR